MKQSVLRLVLSVTLSLAIVQSISPGRAAETTAQTNSPAAKFEPSVQSDRVSKPTPDGPKKNQIIPMADVSPVMPKHGTVSIKPAIKWEDGLAAGNGIMG